MTKLLFALALLALPCSADTISIDFSGVWDINAGAIHAGESFTGWARWDEADYNYLESPTANATFLVPVFLSTFPTLDFMETHYWPNAGGVQPHLFRGEWRHNTPFLPSCLPNAVHTSGIRYYNIGFSPTRPTGVCGDDNPTGSPVAHAQPGSYQLTLTRTPSVESVVAHTPEPGFTLLIAISLLAGFVFRRRSRNHI